MRVLLCSGRDDDDDETHVTRTKPEGLDVLCRDTKFTRKELQIMYRGFKQVTGFIVFYNFKIKSHVF